MPRFLLTPSAGPPGEAWLADDSEALDVASRHLVGNAAALKHSGQTWGSDVGMESVIQDAPRIPPEKGKCGRDE